MKNMKLKTSRSLSSKILRSKGMAKWLSYVINDRLALKGQRLPIGIFVRISAVVVGRRTSALVRANVVLIRRFVSLNRYSNTVFLVKYLKACNILVMQAASGMKISSTQSLGVAVSRTHSGLPRILPSIWREYIRKGDRIYIRLALTLFSLYRILEIPGKLKLNSITDPGLDISGLLHEFKTHIVGQIFANHPIKLDPEEDLRPKLYPISHSSSVSHHMDGGQQSTSLYGIARAASLLVNSNIWEAMDTWCIEARTSFAELIERWAVLDDQTGALGKLGFKAEAAGKVRVFAMVDPFTNWAFAPLAMKIFDYLKTIPMDGTFNQIAPILRLQKLGFTRFWCYDLSSATDRLPVQLQVEVLSKYLGRDMASAWARILVDRDYLARSKTYRLNERLKYAVGQPMGALSSWAMLALTHHCIVQWAYLRSIGSSEQSPVLIKGKSAGYLFKDYAVLGDDIVIANKRVASEYVKLMSALGVGIGLEKSLISSKGGLEFAKRFYIRKIDCSPVPFKEFFAACGNIGEMLQFCRKYRLSIPKVLDAKGAGFRVKGSLSKPFLKLHKRISALILMLTNPVSTKDFFHHWIVKNSLHSELQVSYSWDSVVKEYATVMLRALEDKFDSKMTSWNSICMRLGSSLQFDETEEGFVRDHDLELGYFHGGVTKNQKEDIGKDDFLAPEVSVEIALALYYEPIQASFKEMKDIQQELQYIREESKTWFHSNQIEAIDRLEDLFIQFNTIEDRLENCIIPSDTENRASEDDKRLLKNPLFAAKLWRRLYKQLEKGSKKS